MSEPIDPREMRKRILHFAYGHRDLHGQPQQWGSQNLHGCSSMVQQVISLAQREGFSGEDTMAMIAYHALLSLEQANKRLFDLAVATIPTNHPLNTLAKGQA